LQQQEVVITPFTLGEAAVGVTWARDHHGINLDPGRIAQIATKIRMHMAEAKIGFARARMEVLNGECIKPFGEGRPIWEAYKAALGKMFSLRSARAKKRRPKRAVPKVPALIGKAIGVTTEATGQLSWKL
jgi:hypothetical protein